MQQPDGFIVLRLANKVCKLNRSIYGLKQASRSWNQRFDEIIKEYDFIQNEDDPCVYKKVSGRALTFIVLYVDDVLLIGNDIPMLTSVKAWLSLKFSMKDLGEAAFILGINIYRDRSESCLDSPRVRTLTTCCRDSTLISPRGDCCQCHMASIYLRTCVLKLKMRETT